MYNNSDTKTLEILLIENNKDDAKGIQKSLNPDRYHITNVWDGKKALNFLIKQDYDIDVVLLDKDLPHKNGLEILKETREKEYAFIFLTTDNTAETAVEALHLGALDFLPKSLGFEGLSEMIEKIYEIHQNKLERKQVEKALRESEEKYRLLADNSIDAIWQMDLKLIFTYISPSIKNITGYTVEEWVGTRLSQHADRKEFFNMEKKALHAIKDYKKFKYIIFESVMLKKDGTEISVEITGKLLFNKKGLPVGFQGTTRDITERKQAEEKEKEHIKNIELLSETAMQFVEFPQDKDIYTFIGEKLKEFTGINSIIVVNSVETENNILTNRTVLGLGKLSDKVAGLLGKHPVDMTFNVKGEISSALSDGRLHLNQEGLYGILLKTVPKTVCNSIEKLLKIKEIYGIGFLKDNVLFGNVLIFLREGAGEFENKKIIEAFIKQASIAVQKRQAEDALRESEQLFNNVFESMQEGVFVLNTDFKYTYWNKRMEEISHTQRKDVLGKIPWEIFPFLRSEINEAIKKAMSGDISRNIELKYTLSDEKEEWTTESYFPLKTSEAKIVGTVGVIEEITERKQVEEKLKKKMTELEIFNDAAVNRELIINESRKEINELLRKSGKGPKYEIAE